MQVGHCYDVIGTDRAIGVGWNTPTHVAVSIKADDGSRYPKFAEHSLQNRVRNDWTKRCGYVRQDITVFVLAQRASGGRPWLDGAQGRRYIELHDWQHAAKLSLDNRV